MGNEFTKTKTILSTHKLYDVIPTVFKGMLYEEAISLKITLAQKKLKKLMESGEWVSNNHEINILLNAIKFNHELLDEMGLKRK